MQDRFVGGDCPSHERAALLLCSGEKLQFLLHARPVFEPNFESMAAASRCWIRPFSELLPPSHARPPVVWPKGARNRQFDVLSTCGVVHAISEGWLAAAVKPVRLGIPNRRFVILVGAGSKRGSGHRRVFGIRDVSCERDKNLGSAQG